MSGTAPPEGARRPCREPRCRRVPYVVRAGEQGGKVFTAQKYNAAAAVDEDALVVHGDRRGAAGEQRGDKVKLRSNLVPLPPRAQAVGGS